MQMFIVAFTDMGRLCQQRPSWTRTPINAKVGENSLTLSCVVICCLAKSPCPSQTQILRWDFKLNNISWESNKLGSLKADQWVHYREWFCFYISLPLVHFCIPTESIPKGFYYGLKWLWTESVMSNDNKWLLRVTQCTVASPCVLPQKCVFGYVARVCVFTLYTTQQY